MLAVEAKHFKARSWQKLATLAPKESQKVCQNRENIIKMAPKMGSKSMKNQGCVADAFLERFGAALGCQMLDFGSQNLQKINKMAPKDVGVDPPFGAQDRSKNASATQPRFFIDLGQISGAMLEIF